MQTSELASVIEPLKESIVNYSTQLADNEENKTDNINDDKEETIAYIPKTFTDQDRGLIYELLDRDQDIPSKIGDKETFDPEWKYNILLGDLQKRKVLHEDCEEEILWVAKDDNACIRKVFISLKVKRISAIDNIAETFRMRFHLYLNWILTEKEYKSYYKCKDDPVLITKWIPSWSPKLEFMNSVETHYRAFESYEGLGKYRVMSFKDFAVNKSDRPSKNEFNPRKCKFVRAKLECDITFAEELELQNFPFDCQDLSCIIRGNISQNTNYIFLPELRQHNFASIDPRYSVMESWELMTALIEFGDDMSTRAENRAYPTLVLRLKMKRKFKVFVINIMCVMAGLCALALCSFFLDEDQLGERLSLLMTLVLTAIAFGIVSNERLPEVAYLTFVDKYVLCSYAYFVFCMVESVSVPTIGEEYDQIMYYIAICLWVIYQLVFIIYAYYVRKKEEQKLFYSTDEINQVVSIVKPPLVFDYTKGMRLGAKRRLQCYQAEIKIGDTNNKTLTEKYQRELKRKFEKLQKKYMHTQQLQKRQSIHNVHARNESVPSTMHD